jgi:hypothetical protein
LSQGFDGKKTVATLTPKNAQNKTQNGYYLNEKCLGMLDLPLLRD